MKVALLGYGTVGVGVRKMLQNASDLEAGPVLVRAGKEKESFQTSDFSSILSDPRCRSLRR